MFPGYRALSTFQVLKAVLHWGGEDDFSAPVLLSQARQGLGKNETQTSREADQLGQNGVHAKDRGDLPEDAKCAEEESDEEHDDQKQVGESHGRNLSGPAVKV